MAGAGRRKASDSRDIQKQIVEAAMHTFAEKGFFNTSLREIADKAEVNHGMIRYYFQNKEGLWEAVITYGFDIHMAAMSTFFASVEGQDSLEVFKAFIRESIRVTAEMPAFSSFMHQYNQKDVPKLDLVIEKLNIIGEMVEPYFQDLQSRGYFKNFDTYAHRIYVRALIETPLLISALDNAIAGIDFTSEEGLEKHTRWVLSFIFPE